MGSEGVGIGIEVGGSSKFKHNVSYESPIKKGEDLKVKEQVELYNGRGDNNEMFLISVERKHDNKSGEYWTLAVHDKAGLADNAPSVVEMDFGGKGSRKIRTNNPEDALNAIGVMDHETAPLAADMPELRSLLGERTALPLLAELNKTLPKSAEKSDEAPAPITEIASSTPKPDELKIIKRESAQTAGETERRKQFRYTIDYKNPINSGPLEENVLKAVLEYNSRAQGDVFLQYDLRVSHEPTGEFTLKIIPRLESKGRESNTVEIDFGGPGVKHIRTNSLAMSSAILENLKSETGSFKNVTGALRTMVGDKAQAAFFDNMNVEQIDLQDEIIKNDEIKIIPEASEDQDVDKNKEILKEVEQEDLAPEIELIVPPKKATPTTRFKATVAAALGSLKTEIKYRDKFGHEKTKTQNAQQLVFKEGAFFGAMMSHNSQEINDPDRVAQMGNAERRSKKVLNFFDNFLRGTMTAGIHEGKEMRHAVKLMAAAGIEGGMTNEFFKLVDSKARDAISKERKGIFKKVGGGIRDFFSEVRGAERDLHRKRVEITAIMREQFDMHPFDPDSPMYELVQRDVTAREEFARRLGEMPTELLHAHDQVGGERRDTVTIKQGSEVDNKLKKEVLMPAIRDILKQYDETGLQPSGLSAGLRNNLDRGLRDYFLSSEFQSWKASLPPEQSAKMENSLSYATDILAQFEEVMIPDIITNYDYYKTTEKLDFAIELTIGTGKYGPNGEIPSTQLFSGEQIELNEDVWKVLSKRAEGAEDSSPLFGKQTLVNGTQRAFLNAATDVLVKNEVMAAAVGTGITRGVMALAHMAAAPIAAPIGIVFGSSIMAGFKEYAKLRSERAVVDYEEALGYHRKDNAKRYMEMKLLDYNRIDMSHRAQQFSVLVNKQEFSPTDVLHLMGLVADSQARIELSDAHNINLLSTSKETPNGQSRGLYQREERLHGLALTAAKVKFNQLMSDPARFKEVTALMGLPNAAEFAPSDVLEAFTDSRYVNIETGVKIPEGMLAAFNTPEYQLTPDAQSLKANNDRFETARRWKSAWHGVKTGVIAGIFSGAVSTIATSDFELSHEEIIKSNIEHLDVKLINHLYPLKSMYLPQNSMAHIPMGTTLVPDHDIPGAFDLVVNSTNKHLLENVTFDHGVPHMTPELWQQAATNHVDVTHTVMPEYTGTIDTSTVHENVTLHFDKMEGVEQGTDGWIAHNLDQSYAENPSHAISDLPDVNVEYATQINGIRELTQGWEIAEAQLGNDHFGIDQIEGVHRVIHHDATFGTAMNMYQAPNAYVEDVPWILGTEEGHRGVADLIHESMQMNAAGIKLDPLHQAVLDMSYVGTHATAAQPELETIPTPEEVKLIFDAINERASAVGGTPPNDAWFKMTQDLTQQISIAKPELYTNVAGSWDANFMTYGIGLGYTQGLESPSEEKLKLDDKQESLTPPLSPPSLLESDEELESSNKLEFPRAPLDISDIRKDIAAELVTEMDNNNKGLVEGGEAARLAIHTMMSTIANNHHLPIAYVLKEGRVKLLTRPPEFIDKDLKDRARIYFFNTTTGKEETEEITVSGSDEGENKIFMSGIANFPAGSSDQTTGFFTDYDLANGFFKSIAYDLSGFELPESENVENKPGAWADDIVIAIAFAEMASLQKEIEYIAKKVSEMPPISEEEKAFQKDLSINVSEILLDLNKVLGPEAEAQIKLVDDSFESTKFLHSVINEVADSNHVPIAYIRDGERIRILTRAPEVVDEGHSKVFYYDTQKGMEQEMVVETNKEASEKHMIHFSGEDNFGGDANGYQTIQNDHKLAAEFMNKSGYDFHTEQHDISLPELPPTIPLWIVDIIFNIGYVKTLIGGKPARSAEEIQIEFQQMESARKAIEPVPNQS